MKVKWLALVVLDIIKKSRRIRLAIRKVQRRAYGLRDPDYLRLKILTCMLPVL